METNKNNNPGSEPIVDVRDAEINRLKNENDKLRNENDKLRNENEELGKDLSLHKSLYATLAKQNKSLTSRIEAITKICEI